MQGKPTITRNWNYDDWFRVPRTTSLHPVIAEAKSMADAKKISAHPFMERAAQIQEPLVYWTRQELVVTGPFSLFLFKICSQLKNVHIRALMSEIAHGEHGSVSNGIAHRSHPWLLHKLAESMEIDVKKNIPEDETLDYLATLEEESNYLLRGLGALGIGSEYLLLEEYSAIRRAFEVQHPGSEYEDFLNSNIVEDRWHSSLIEVIASELITSRRDAGDFITGASKAVEGRITFYDSALTRFSP